MRGLRIFASRRCRVGIATLCGAAGMLTAPATAPAATQLGQVAPNSASAGGCSGATLFIQSRVAGPPSYTVPAGGGVITSWSVQGAPSDPGQLKLKLGRGGPSDWVIAGESSFETVLPSMLNTYSTRIPVSGDEVLGLWVPGAGGPCIFTTSSGGDGVRFRNPDNPEPGVGQTFSTPVGESNARVNLSANLEPDCDGDGFGDETQDPSLFGGNCPARGRNVILDANKNKVKKGKKVTLTGSITEQARAGECQGGQTVDLQRKRPSQTTFTTFMQVQTDAQGAFSLKKKVKKTFEYRAQVVETGTCTSALSNSEKVKVKKKK
jgi:hypothetical protein